MAAVLRVARTVLPTLAMLLAAVAVNEAAARSLPSATGEVATRHALKLPDRTLAFRAVVGSVPILHTEARPEAQAGVIAFLADAVDRTARPVTFIVGGGPSSSSAYLNIGAIGPWRIDFDASASIRRSIQPNAETWLDFTDLVFIDPPGTGLGRIVRSGAGVRERLWSVAGDVEALAAVIARWLVANDRLGSPKALLGQSYGGFRAPRLAEVLRARHGVALNGLVLVSPVLDYGWRNHARTSPLSFASLLPSFAAARLEREGRFSSQMLADVEAYAAGDFMTDFLLGPADDAAVERIVARVATITGLSIEVVRATRGRINEDIFVRETARAQARVVSSYDPRAASADPDPTALRPDFADPFLEAIKAPLTVAMTQLLHRRLGVTARVTYEVSSDMVFDAWNWGTKGGLPESVSDLRRILALDPKLQLLVAHGYSDLEAPYFETKLILDQLPNLGDPARLMRRNYRGGHMFYSSDASRSGFRADAEAMYRTIGAQR